jgi:glycosidase
MHAPIGTRWSDVVQLNHDSPLVQHELIEVLSFWLKMGFDGFRYDAAACMPKHVLQRLIESANAMVGERLHHWCDSSELLAEVDGMTAFLDHHSVVRLKEGEPVGLVLEQRHRDGIFYLTNHDSLHQKGSALKQWGTRYSVIRDELALRKGHLMLSFCEWRQPSATYSFLD